MRWATFDCYGTLVDWNAGIAEQLARIFGADHANGLLERYHEIEPEIQEEHPTWSYREVMSSVLTQLADEQGHALASEDHDSLARSLPTWPVFEEVSPALAELRRRGWRLAILSNTDRDFITASMRSIGIPFEFAIVASEIGSYKPAPGHWETFQQQAGAGPSSHVHVAASEYHDIRPARSLGIVSVWINRLGEASAASPSRELPDLAGLPDTLDELIPQGSAGNA